MIKQQKEKIAVIGSGKWGTALGLVLAKHGHSVLIWGRNADMISSFEKTRSFPPLGQEELPTHLHFTSDLHDLHTYDYVILSLPTQGLNTTLPSLKHFLNPSAPLIQTAKGICLETHKFPYLLTQEAFPSHSIALLSGPSFALDVAQGLPTAVTLACSDSHIAQRVQSLYHGSNLRLYASKDYLGVSLGGSLKNVIAIGCGIAIGYGLGDSARASLAARGFAEIKRLALALGAECETLMGLSGLGDLMLTCTSPLSRNFSYGMKLGQTQAITALQETVEGYHTAKAVIHLASQYKIDMPICEAICKVISGQTDIATTIEALLNRPFKAE